MELWTPRVVVSVGEEMIVILTVEDEFLIREQLGEALADAGYRVIAAANADEAIAVLETRRDVSILITDVNMPGSMDGLKLAAAVRDRWPPVAIIIATGDSRPAAERMPAHSQFLSKPFRKGRVLSVVAEACKRAGANKGVLTA
jgi:two-component system, response regulator PdtaR